MNIQELQEEIVKDFEPYKEWLDRYNHLIELGKQLPSLENKYKTDENIIRGCQVKVWFHSECREGRVFFQIDSLSHITRGIIFLLIKVLSGQKAEEIKGVDLYFIDKIGLRDSFSPTKANGLFKMERKMKLDAERYEKEKNGLN
jgi:cysteine desulfuration protein SufE